MTDLYEHGQWRSNKPRSRTSQMAELQHFRELSSTPTENKFDLASTRSGVGNLYA
ncbi:MAG TPA: hypothetical protein VN673_05350 [Clostridia bacterium]|nr:hypothetical protein [Clostridia bacterium]